MYALGRLIYRYTTKNKGRTLFLGFSIIVSAAMIFFMQIFASDMSIDKEIRYNNLKGGKYTCSVYTKNEQYKEYAKDIDIVKNISCCLTTENYFTLNQQKDGKAELVGFEDNVDELMSFKLVDGIYPRNNNEIALDKFMLEDIENPPKVGDKIKLYRDTLDLELEYTLTGIFEHTNINDSNKGIFIAYVTLEDAKNFLKEHNGKKDGEILYEFLIETPN